MKLNWGHLTIIEKMKFKFSILDKRYNLCNVHSTLRFGDYWMENWENCVRSSSSAKICIRKKRKGENIKLLLKRGEKWNIYKTPKHIRNMKENKDFYSFYCFTLIVNVVLLPSKKKFQSFITRVKENESERIFPQ